MTDDKYHESLMSRLSFMNPEITAEMMNSAFESLASFETVKEMELREKLAIAISVIEMLSKKEELPKQARAVLEETLWKLKE